MIQRYCSIKVVTNSDNTVKNLYYISETEKKHDNCQINKNDTKISSDKTHLHRHKSTKTNEIKVCINNPGIYIDIPDNKTQADSNKKNDSYDELYKDSPYAPFTYYGISDTFIEIPLDELVLKHGLPTPHTFTLFQ